MSNCQSVDVLRLTWDFEVNTVAVIFIAAMRVEQTFSAQTVERLSRRDQVVSVDADAYVLLLPLDIICRGHAGAIRLTLKACLLTVCAVAA